MTDPAPHTHVSYGALTFSCIFANLVLNPSRVSRAASNAIHTFIPMKIVPSGGLKTLVDSTIIVYKLILLRDECLEPARGCFALSLLPNLAFLHTEKCVHMMVLSTFSDDAARPASCEEKSTN